MESKRARVLIAEDHTLVRQGTRQILEYAGFEVVAEAADGDTAVELARRLKPDVALLDLRLPGLNGIEATREIVRLEPSIRVVILSAYDDDDYVLAAMDAGASGYILKTTTGQALAEAIRGACCGEMVLDTAVANKVRRLLSRGTLAGEASAHRLTERERQILQLAAQGLRNKEIARTLRISIRTVEDHMGRIFEKLGASSRTEAVMRAVARGWLSLPGAQNGSSNS